MRLALTKGEQSRGEDHEIIGENITHGSCHQCILCDNNYVRIVGRLFYPILTAHGPFRPRSDFKTHFALQKPLTTAV